MNARFLLLAGFAVFAVPNSSLAQSQFWLATPNLDVKVFDAFGVGLAGSNYQVELWGGVTPEFLEPTLRAYTRERAIIPFLSDGFFLDGFNMPAGRGYSTVFDVLAGDPCALQVRAWDARLGATYEDVVALGLGGYGESPIFTGVGTYPFLPLPASPARLHGLQSFSLRPVVPEPSTWALLAGSSVVLCFRLCRRRAVSVSGSARSGPLIQ